jgi:alkylhydroperoxidase family enzyme
MIADKVSKLDADTLGAVRSGDLITDEKLQALASFTTRIFLSRGLIAKPEAAAFLAASYEEQQIMEIVLAIVVTTLSNYSNHIFHTELDDVFIPYAVQEDGFENL